MNRDYIVVSVNGNKLENIKESTMDNIIAQIGGVLLNNSTIMPDDIIVTVTSEKELMSSFVSKTFDDKKSKKDEDTKEDEIALMYIKRLYINMYNTFNRKAFITDLIASVSGKDKRLSLINAVKILGKLSEKRVAELCEKYNLVESVFKQIKLGYELVIM